MSKQLHWRLLAKSAVTLSLQTALTFGGQIPLANLPLQRDDNSANIGTGRGA